MQWSGSLDKEARIAMARSFIVCAIQDDGKASRVGCDYLGLKSRVSIETRNARRRNFRHESILPAESHSRAFFDDPVLR